MWDRVCLAACVARLEHTGPGERRMPSGFDHRRERLYAPFQHDSSAATLAALLLALLGAGLVVVLALGWRPQNDPRLVGVQRWFQSGTLQDATVRPSVPTEWAIPGGWFFAHPPPKPGDVDVTGYTVTDADGLHFWTEYQRLGGPTYLGYPRSTRISQDGVVSQVFQRAVLRYKSPDTGITVVPLLDQLHADGHDSRLAAEWGIPAAEPPLPSDLPPEKVAERLDSVVQDFPAFAAYLARVPDAAKLLGGPTSTVHDVGPYYALRLQGGVLQQWKDDVPWAKAGEVTAANVGDIAIELGVVPSAALEPESVRSPAAEASVAPLG
jgi:hypothetical protein